jgi:hypothetical protein
MTQVYTRPTRGATDEWITPRWITERLGHFDLDPCRAVGQPWDHADAGYTVEDDGLAQDWTGRVWLNSPYGPEVGLWLEKLADHGNGIALTFARTDTRWFAEQIWKRAHGILFMHGRPKFFRPDGTEAKGNSGGALSLTAYGKANVEALRQSWIPGWLLTGWWPSPPLQDTGPGFIVNRTQKNGSGA